MTRGPIEIKKTYVGKGFIDPSPFLITCSRIVSILTQIAILANSAILIYFGIDFKMIGVLVMSCICVVVITLGLMCQACNLAGLADDAQNIDITEMTETSDVIELEVVNPEDRSYTISVMQLLMLGNLISNTFFYVLYDATSFPNADIVIPLSWLNVALLVIACIFCYIYAKNFVWIIGCTIVNRLYPTVMKFERSMVTSPEYGSEVDPFLMMEKFNKVPVAIVDDLKEFLKAYEKIKEAKEVV